VHVRRRILVATGTVIALLVGVITLLASAGATSASHDHCTRLSAQSQAREQLVTGHGPRVVVIGDSYAVGLGLRRPATSWPSRLPGRVTVFGFSGSGFSVHSSPCAGASYAARAPQALRGGADLVVVEGGLNDYDQPTSAIRSGFRSLARELAGHRVLVVGPPPAPVRAAAALRVDAVLRAESARAHLRYLPMITESLPYLGDRLHLTPAGHVDFGNVVRRALLP
jgi:acyl-CoA thioesterase-1